MGGFIIGLFLNLVCEKKWSTPGQILFQLILIIIVLVLYNLYTGKLSF